VYATRVTNLGKKRIVLECKDPAFPADAEWPASLPRCFPDFPLAASGGAGEQSASRRTEGEPQRSSHN
jgi:hypothetical protein